jgi:integrase
MKPAVSIYFDTRYKPKNSDEYPFKLRVWYDGDVKFYPLNKFSNIEDAEKIMGSKPRQKYKAVRDELDGRVKNANAVIGTLLTFSFDQFELTFFNKPERNRQEVFNLWQAYIDSLSKEGRAGSAKTYGNAIVSFRKYKPDLVWTEITPDFLRGFERNMVESGNGITTVGIYTTCLRTIVNRAIEKGYVRKEQYPFGERKYAIPKGQNIKKALRIKDIELLYKYQAEPYSWEDQAKDFWLFSYMANGMNFEDLANLRFSNILGNKIEFVRQKTKRKERTQKKIEVFLNERMLEIIKKWGNANGKPDDYVFKIFDRSMNPVDRLKTRYQFIKQVNKYMRQIALSVGIEKDITTYTARHTFANVMKQAGAPIAFISDSLGHSDAKVTENYLDSFEDDTRMS